MAEETKKVEAEETPTEGAMTSVETETTPAPAKSKKDTYMEGFRKNHPDWQDDDEEGFYGALSEEADAWGKEREGYQAREDEVSNAIANGGAVTAALFGELMNGTPIPLALLKRYPNEIKDWLENPENVDAVEKVMQDNAAAIEQDKKLKEEADANLEESNKMIDQMIADGEIKDDEEVNDLLKFLGEIAIGLTVNQIKKEWLIAAKNAINHDADVEAAKTQGEIDGRNAKIVAQKAESKKGNNTHSGLGSGNAGQRLSQKETAKITGNGGTGRRDMWANMKTNKLS